MFRLTAFLILLLAASFGASADGETSVFHRLLLLNEKNEMLLVKIKKYDFWVTPGWYQDGERTVQEGVAALAADHGLTMTRPEIRGVFTLKNPARNMLSTRIFHVARLADGELKLPDMISEAQWVPVDEAYERMSFEHISVLAKLVIDHPDTIWGGAMERYGEGFAQKAAVSEPFYPMFEKN